MRIKVIMNPWSDQRRAIRQRPRLQTLGHHHGGFELDLTKRPGHGQELARVAAESGYEIVVAAGGDGTVHEVVNGLMKSQRKDTLLGVIPIGTGNDFAYGMGLPLNDIEAAVSRLFSGRPRTVDLGHVFDDRGQAAYFDNNLGIGTDAIVVMRSEAITRLRGFLLYLAAVFQTIAFYYRAFGLQIVFDAEQVSQQAILLACGIGPRHGGGFFLTPDAAQDDDLIDSCTANPISRLTMIRLVLQSLKGQHVTSKHVAMRQNKSIVVQSNMPMPIHIDGEMFAYPKDNVRQVTITSVPSAVRVIA